MTGPPSNPTSSLLPLPLILIPSLDLLPFLNQINYVGVERFVIMFVFLPIRVSYFSNLLAVQLYARDCYLDIVCHTVVCKQALSTLSEVDKMPNMVVYVAHTL